MIVPTYAGAYAVIVDDHRMLLTHWIGVPERGAAPAWTLPGGGIERGESPEETVVRELREEAGYDVEPTGLLRVDTDWTEIDGADAHRIRILFSARIVGGELGVTEVDGSTDDVRWVPLDEVEGLPRVPMVDVAVRLIRERVRG